MITRSFFAKDVLAETTEEFAELSLTISRESEKAAPNQIIQIPLSSLTPLISQFPEALRRKIEQYGIYSLRLELRHPPSPAHSGWLFNAYLETLKCQGEQLSPPGSSETRVGIRLDNYYDGFEQFSLVQQRHKDAAYFAALGPNAQA